MPSEPIEFSYSPLRMIGLALAGVGMTALSLFAARMMPADAQQVVAWFGVLFFGLCAVLALLRLLRDRGKAIVRLTDSGFTDIRLAPAEIPWSAIRDIGTGDVMGQKFLVLDVEPEVESALPMRRAARLSRAANAKLGMNGLTTTAQGLPVSHDRLLALCSERLREAAQRGTTAPARAIPV